MCYLRPKIAGRIFAVIIFCSGVSPLFGQDQNIELTEYEVKSGLLYRVCLFSVWPEMFDTDSIFVIAVIGEIEDGEEIVIPGNILIGNRKIDIRKVNSIHEIKDPKALFIYSSMSDSLELIIDYVKDKPILTFGDTKGFAERGVIVNFYLEEDGVEFEINRQFAEQSIVRLNAQLFAIGGRIIK